MPEGHSPQPSTPVHIQHNSGDSSMERRLIHLGPLPVSPAAWLLQAKSPSFCQSTALYIFPIAPSPLPHPYHQGIPPTKEERLSQ